MSDLIEIKVDDKEAILNKLYKLANRNNHSSVELCLSDEKSHRPLILEIYVHGIKI